LPEHAAHGNAGVQTVLANRDPSNRAPTRQQQQPPTTLGCSEKPLAAIARSTPGGKYLND
jgi:hypothetical protein